MSSYNVIGIMSGTSLDGLDICNCIFNHSPTDKTWSFEIKYSKTIDIPPSISEELKKAPESSGLELSLLSNRIGDFFGDCINTFILLNGIDKNQIEFVASHGHTVFHQPENGLTLQIGNGANIAAKTELKTISDFRSIDLALGGNGAPLVPIGDQLLFNEFEYCVNLGGIANISYESENKKRLAYDICTVNMLLNTICRGIQLEYDAGGKIAESGKLNQNLFAALNSLSYYQKAAPKSLGHEWFMENLMPIIKQTSLSTEDLLNTCTEHIAYQIGSHIQGDGTALFTGGGTHNTFLMERIAKYSKADTHIPSIEIIDFKEALLFGFLGVLRVRNEINTLNSVTGSRVDSVGGCIYNPFPSL